MTNVNADPPSQGESGHKESSPPHASPVTAYHGGNKVYKSGPLFLSSKGIGWTSWKKRWFILTRTSLVFFRSDPNVIHQKGSEVNLTLGGIDLNSSGSVVVKEDKKLLTVNFPDGRDGRTFTLKAETLEDLQEWKTALEEALSDAPSAAHAVGQNGKLKNDQGNAADVSSEQSKDRQVKSLVIGRPILLALEDIDGTPSFLEKALRFVEENGVKTEGILRQAADVDDVEYRIREFEKGKTEFSPDEDAHVIADCVKYVIRELPSSPVPASCCKALLEACKTERSMRVNAMRTAICETFPEPNRRLLQRILIMMQTVASNKTVNRMSISAVAACMAPLLLRPLLAGDCELENDFDVGGDGSAQLLQAAAAANHAQAIAITLLEEYDNIFGEGSVTPEPYTDSEESGSESEEITDDDEGSFDDDGDDYATEDSRVDMDEDYEHELSSTCSDTTENEYNQKISENQSSGSKFPPADSLPKSGKHSSSSPPHTASPLHVGMDDSPRHGENDSKMRSHDSSESLGGDPGEASAFQKSSKQLHGPASSARHAGVLGRTSGKKNLSMESIDIPFEEEAEIQKLETTKTDLQNKISMEAKANSLLQESLEKRKHDLHARRLALEKDVGRLQEQLKKEMELRAALEGELRISKQPSSVSSNTDEKQLKADLEEIAQTEAVVFNLKHKSDNLESQPNQNREHNSGIRKKKHVDVGTLNILSASENSSRSKHDFCLDSPGIPRDKKLESPSSRSKPLPLNQQADGVQNPKGTGVSTMESNSELRTKMLGAISSRKSNLKGEGAISTTSALSKLTNRLNLLKEKRSQIASELQNVDKSRNSTQPAQNLGQGRGSEHFQSHQDSKEPYFEKSRESDSYESSHKSDDNKTDRGTRTEVLPNLDRGKSGSFPPVDKSSSKSKVTPRTFSR